MDSVTFDSSFEFGVATASYQIEGAWNEDGKSENIWDRFSHTPGNIADHTTGDVACDFYHRYKEDIELAGALGIQVFRLSVSWSRIFPNGVEKPNPSGVEFYRNVLKELKKKGIKVSLTIYHWDLPQKLQDLGGWANRESIKWFTDYASFLFDTYGEYVDYWTTINEPFCIAMLGYWSGEHAPGYHDFSMMLQVVHHLLLAHGHAVKEFRKRKLTSKIGIVLNMNLSTPADPTNQKDVDAANRMMQFGNCLFGDPIYLGSYPEQLLDYFKKQRIVLPEILEGDMEIIHQPTDFFGLNTYTAGFISHDPTSWPLQLKITGSGRPVTDAMWEVCPDKFYELLIWINQRYQPSNLIITENGAATNDWVTSAGEVLDTNRIEYLKLYLNQVAHAIQAGIPITGYYIWCFTDNFEWAFGLNRRFGIIYMDYQTQKRIPKASAKWFSNLIKNRNFEL